MLTLSPTHFVLGSNLPHCLLLANAPETDKKDLLSELELMKTLKPHDHVIKLLGCVTESGKQFLSYIIISHNNFSVGIYDLQNREQRYFLDGILS